MAEHIPFITSESVARLATRIYGDSHCVRLRLDKAERIRPLLPPRLKIWLDPCVDGLDDLKSKRGQQGTNDWFDFMSSFASFDKMRSPAFHKKPETKNVQVFVKAVMNRCQKHRPAWITVPQIPFVKGSERNKINLALAEATGKWRIDKGFSGRLILPLVFTHQNQVNGKTARNPNVALAAKCYKKAQADGFWVVDKSLEDENGSSTLKNKRFPGLVALHQELNERISSRIRIAGPYWGMNLLLWARGLVDYAAIGVGSGYQYRIPGGIARQPSARLAIPPLRRRVVWSTQLRSWLLGATGTLAKSHPVRSELRQLKNQLPSLRQADMAREQVANFYKQWFDIIASTPKTGRSMALFQDLSAAYALGRPLPDLGGTKGPARRPEAVAEPLMLSCL